MINLLIDYFNFPRIEKETDEEYKKRFSKHINNELNQKEINHKNQCNICSQKNLRDTYNILLCVTCLVNLTMCFERNYPNYLSECLSEIKRDFFLKN